MAHEGFGREAGIEAARNVALRSITLPDLSALAGRPKLCFLQSCSEIRTTCTFCRNSSGSSTWNCGCSVVSPISARYPGWVAEYLFQACLKSVTALPSFRKLPYLHLLKLHRMRGIRDLSPLRDAPALEDLIVIEAYHMKPATFSAWWDIPLCKELSLLWPGRGKIKSARAVAVAWAKATRGLNFEIDLRVSTRHD